MFEKGHLIMLGNSLVGKLSITNFAAFILKRKFIEIEENILEKTIKIEKTDKNDKNVTQTVEIKKSEFPFQYCSTVLKVYSFQKYKFHS